MRRWQLVIDDTGSVEDIYASIYCTEWRSGQVLPMPHSQTLKDSATQLLIKDKSGALVTQYQSGHQVKFFSFNQRENLKNIEHALISDVYFTSNQARDKEHHRDEHL